MMIRLLLALAIIFFLFWLMNKIRGLPPNERKRILFKYVGWGLIAVVIAAVATGRMHWLGAVVAAAVGMVKMGLHTFLRATPLLNFIRSSKIFGDPVFRTEFLKITIDLQSGSIEGEVLSGPHEGKNLSELSNDELGELENYYKDRENRSYYLIRVFRQRASASGRGKHQQGDSKENYAAVGDPSVDEAKQILGLKEDRPDKDAIVKAHRRLMQKLHPDRGGNDYLASRINLAKEILFKSFGYH